MCLLHFREVRKPCVMIDGQTCAAASRPQCVSVAAMLVVAIMEEKMPHSCVAWGCTKQFFVVLDGWMHAFCSANIIHVAIIQVHMVIIHMFCVHCNVPSKI